MNRKLSDEQVAEIRLRFERRLSTPKELAYEFGVAYSTVTRIVRHKRRTGPTTLRGVK